MESKTRTGLTWKKKKESAPEPTPLIEKMKPELSPIFEKKGNQNHHLENDANWNWWFPLEPGNWPTLVWTFLAFTTNYANKALQNAF
jgi:hypothetical protein